MSLSNFSSHLSRSQAVCPAPGTRSLLSAEIQNTSNRPGPAGGSGDAGPLSQPGLHMTASVVTGSLEVARLTCSEAALWCHWRLGLMLLAWSGVD